MCPCLGRNSWRPIQIHPSIRRSPGLVALRLSFLFLSSRPSPLGARRIPKGCFERRLRARRRVIFRPLKNSIFVTCDSFPIRPKVTPTWAWSMLAWGSWTRESVSIAVPWRSTPAFEGFT